MQAQQQQWDNISETALRAAPDSGVANRSPPAGRSGDNSVLARAAAPWLVLPAGVAGVSARRALPAQPGSMTWPPAPDAAGDGDLNPAAGFGVGSAGLWAALSPGGGGGRSAALRRLSSAASARPRESSALWEHRLTHLENDGSQTVCGLNFGFISFESARAKQSDTKGPCRR